MEYERNPAPFAHVMDDDELLKDANSWYSAAQLEEIERQKQEDAKAIWQVYFRLKGGDDISDEKIEALGAVYNRLMKQTPAPETKMTGWTEVTPNMPFELLKSITVDNQVLAYERGRYFNAWLTFDEYEGGWCWVDDNDSEPTPSHYLPLSEVALTTEGQP